MIQTKLEEVEKKEDIDPVELRHFLWNMEDDMLQDDETYEPDNDAIEAEEPEVFHEIYFIWMKGCVCKSLIGEPYCFAQEPVDANTHSKLECGDRMRIAT